MAAEAVNDSDEQGAKRRDQHALRKLRRLGRGYDASRSEGDKTEADEHRRDGQVHQRYGPIRHANAAEQHQ
jgi:hypothetical protein